MSTFYLFDVTSKTQNISAQKLEYISEQPGDEHLVQKRFATSETEQIGSHLSGGLVAKANLVSGLWWDDLQHYSKVSFE